MTSVATKIKSITRGLRGKKSTVKPDQKKASAACCSREEEVRHKAYELYEKGGRRQGEDLKNWTEAERLMGRL